MKLSFNKAAILASLLMGNGRGNLDTITAYLGMPPPLVSASYSLYNKGKRRGYKRVAMSLMVEVVKYLRHMEGKQMGRCD